MSVPSNPLLRESAQAHTLCQWAQPNSIPPDLTLATASAQGQHLSQGESTAKTAVTQDLYGQDQNV